MSLARRVITLVYKYLCSQIVVTTFETTSLSEGPCSATVRNTYCIFIGLEGSFSFQLSLTSRTISSIHFLSAGVNPAERSNFGSRNSKVKVSICEIVGLARKPLPTTGDSHLRSPEDRFLSVALQWSLCFHTANIWFPSAYPIVGEEDMVGRMRPMPRRSR
jgi:hypothetical protein